MPENQRTTSGGGLKVGGICLIILGSVLYAALGGPAGNLAGLFGPIVMIPGLFLYFRGRQQAAKARAADPAGPLQSSSPDVLYLRSFQSDTSTTFKKLMSGLTTEEEQLADVLRPFGEMVAIGRPGESLPLPGAARIYATDSEWKGVVLDHMRSAPLVVIRAGTGTGLLWEFEQAFSNLHPAKIVIFVMNITKHDYSAFADQMRTRFQLTLPDIGTFGLLRAAIDLRDTPSKMLLGFIRFSDSWNPEFLPLPSINIRLGYNDARKSFNLALRPVFEQHDIAWQPVGRF